jgi:hypothetical protein
MDAKTGAASDARLFKSLLLPSFLSGFIAFVTSITLFLFSVILTHFGNTVQQSAFGLQHELAQSSVGTISANLAGNHYLNDVLLFLLWGSIGLVVFMIVQGLWVELSRASDLAHQLNYINADRGSIVRGAFIRALVKTAAFIAWWVLFRYAIFTVAPYTITAAHTLALHPAALSNWEHGILAFVVCIVVIHILVVLMRLMVLRSRVFGQKVEG